MVATFFPVLVVFANMAGDLRPHVASTPLMIISNSDGTFTVQRVPSGGTGTDTRGKAGLAIVPQVVVPIVPSPEKKR